MFCSEWHRKSLLMSNGVATLASRMIFPSFSISQLIKMVLFINTLQGKPAQTIEIFPLEEWCLLGNWMKNLVCLEPYLQPLLCLLTKLTVIFGLVLLQALVSFLFLQYTLSVIPSLVLIFQSVIIFGIELSPLRFLFSVGWLGRTKLSQQNLCTELVF